MSTLPVPEIKEIVVLTNGGRRFNYNAIYVNNKLEWADVCYAEEYADKLLELLVSVGNSRIPNSVKVDEVPELIARRMGNGVAYPNTYSEYLNFDTWLVE